MKSVYAEKGDDVEIRWSWANRNDEPEIFVFEYDSVTNSYDELVTNVTIGNHSATIKKYNIDEFGTKTKYKVVALVDGTNYTREASLYIIGRYL